MELWHILPVNINARVSLTLDLFFSKLGYLTGSACSIHVPNLECIDLIVFEIYDYKMKISWPRF